MAVITPTTVEQRDTKPPNDKEIEGNTEGGEDERQQRRDENEGSTKREETGDDEGIGEKRQDKRTPAPARTANEIACEPKWFDWATEIEELIGPVPSMSDFHPTMPSQPIRAPPKPNNPAVMWQIISYL
jgi:hypothetical protein